MDTSRKLSASTVIDAPPSAVFAVLADPNKHTELDSGGMVKGPDEGTPPLGGIGQVFAMNMHQDALGDYRMINTVTAYVPDARIGWGPAMDPDCAAAQNFEGVDVSGHTYTWDLAPEGDGTRVTETYDWMSVKDEQFLKLFPLVSESDLEASLQKLASAVK